MQADRGLSLVEAIISATVLALAVAFALTLLPSSALSTRRAQERVFAANQAQSLLEFKRAYPDLASGVEIYDEFTHDGVEYRRELDVQTAVSTGGTTLPDTYRVKVTVYWSHGSSNFEAFREGVIGPRF